MILRALAGYMNRLPMVRWDRYVSGDYTGETDLSYLTAYGWIERPESLRADFVILEFSRIKRSDGSIDPDAVYATTSSAEHSREIQKLIRGTDEGHVDCIRIEDAFAGLVENVARAK